MTTGSSDFDSISQDRADTLATSDFYNGLWSQLPPTPSGEQERKRIASIEATIESFGAGNRIEFSILAVVEDGCLLSCASGGT